MPDWLTGNAKTIAIAALAVVALVAIIVGAVKGLHPPELGRACLGRRLRSVLSAGTEIPRQEPHSENGRDFRTERGSPGFRGRLFLCVGEYFCRARPVRFAHIDFPPPGNKKRGFGRSTRTKRKRTSTRMRNTRGRRTAGVRSAFSTVSAAPSSLWPMPRWCWSVSRVWRWSSSM